MALVLPNPKHQESTNENVKTRDASLQAIQDWLAKQPHLPDSWDDAGIMAFLRWSQFALEMTKNKLDAYFTVRTAFPEFFTNRNIKTPELQETIKNVVCCTMPTLRADCDEVVVFRINENPPLNVLTESTMKLCMMLSDVRLFEDPEELVGDIIIIDAGTLTASHYARINPILIKKYVIAVQEAFPERVKHIHIVNTHPLIEQLFSLVKRFLREKIRKRFHFHTNQYESLHEFVPRHILPEEYGGTAGKLQEINDKSIKKMEEYIPWFEKQEKLKVHESRRPGKPTNYDDLFGMDGSFKQLAVD